MSGFFFLTNKKRNIYLRYFSPFSMKKILLFLLFCLSFWNLSVHASEQSRLENLFWNDTYSFASYDTRNLESDILKQKSENEDFYANAIQMHSKEPGWKKNIFTDFAKALSIKDTKKSSQLFFNNWRTIDPFTPTCCTLHGVGATKPMKNGILVLNYGGQDGPSYFLRYIYMKDSIIYNITFDLWFFQTFDSKTNKKVISTCYTSQECYTLQAIDGSSEPPSINTPPESLSTLRKWFLQPTLQKVFSRKYDSFLNDMTRFMKQ